MDIRFDQYELTGLDTINVVLGKNGCGKSSLLRAFETSLPDRGYVQYISPERGGNLQLEGSIETSLQQGTWLADSRRRNQADNFRQTSVSQFKRLETLALREIEQKPEIRANMAITFDTTVSKINALLDNIEIFRSDNGSFRVRAKGGGAERQPATLSSGEAELVSLAIEILTYAYIARSEPYVGKSNWLLVDEPDVHLHPDLQHKLMHLLIEAVKPGDFRVLASTHSTSIVSALTEVQDTKVALMRTNQKKLNFEKPSEAFQRVLPIFGAHPLSNIYNANPVLLVEGEDDERIWQTAVRSAKGAIRLWPCVAGDIQSLNEYETMAKEIIEAVYDGGVGYSLRDRDGSAGELEDVGPVRRAKLSCRAGENLLLTTESLAVMGVTWDVLKARLEAWLQVNQQHPRCADMKTFADGGWDRKSSDLKELRNLIVGLAGVSKPWEIVVGQALAKLKSDKGDKAAHTLRDYLGTKAVEMLGLTPDA